MPDLALPTARVRIVNVRRKLPPYYEGYGAAEQLGSVIAPNGLIRPVPKCPYERGTDAHHFYYIGVSESVQDHAARKKRGR